MLKYLELNDDKQPVTTFDVTHNSLEGLRNAGLLLSTKVVVVDFDNDNYEESKIIDYFKTNYPTLWVKTTRGIHFYYMVPPSVKLKSKADIITVGGFQCDYKTGKNTYGVIKHKGKMRETNGELRLKDLPELPQLLWQVPIKVNLSGMEEGGRNNAINSHLYSVRQTYPKLDIKAVGEFINSNIFITPLKPKELEATIESVAGTEIKRKFITDNGTIDVIELSKYILKELDIHLYNTFIYFNNGKRYVSDTRLLLQRVTGEVDGLKYNQDKELQHQIWKRATETHTDIKKFPIQLKNGYIKDGKFIPMEGGLFTPFVLDVTYDAEAYDKYVDKFLNDVSCGKMENRRTLEEILGHILMIDRFPAHVFFLKGNGKNGKSTFLEMVNEFVGDMGTTISLEAFNDNTSVSMLNGKLVNCADETDDIYIDKCKGFKSLASGNTISVRPVYARETVKVKKTATLLLNANKMPNFKDKTGGFFRRLRIIPFNYVLTKENIIPNLLDLMSTENAKSYILNLALTGLERIVSNRYAISENPYMDAEIEEYILETDTVARYLQEYPDIHGKPTKLVHTQYEAVTEEDGNRPLSLTEFTKRLKDFGYKSDTRNGKRCYLKIEFIGKNVKNDPKK